MVKSKKGFIRTVEAVIAIAIIFTFITLFIPAYTVTKSDLKNEEVLLKLGQDPEFRTCVLYENSSCINQSLSKDLEAYNYAINISKNPNDRASGIPEKRTFSESLFISGNNTFYGPRIIRIYYWGK